MRANPQYINTWNLTQSQDLSASVCMQMTHILQTAPSLNIGMEFVTKTFAA